MRWRMVKSMTRSSNKPRVLLYCSSGEDEVSSTLHIMKSSTIKSLFFGLFFLAALLPIRGFAQQPSPDSQRISILESRVSSLESRIHSADAGVAVWLFGAFCALWAQNTGRNAWLWFFLGLFFSVITVLVLLEKNSNDRKGRT